MWRFFNRHGIGNKVVRDETGSADIGAAEPLRLKFHRLMKNEDFHLCKLYNANETALFWCSRPRNTQAFINENKIHGRKISKDKFPALLDANTSRTHRLKPVIVAKAAKPRAPKDCMHELLVVYYNTEGEACAHFLAAVVFTGSVFECRKPHRCKIDMGSVVRLSG